MPVAIHRPRCRIDHSLVLRWSSSIFERIRQKTAIEGLAGIGSGTDGHAFHTPSGRRLPVTPAPEPFVPHSGWSDRASGISICVVTDSDGMRSRHDEGGSDARRRSTLTMRSSPQFTAASGRPQRRPSLRIRSRCPTMEVTRKLVKDGYLIFCAAPRSPGVGRKRVVTARTGRHETNACRLRISDRDSGSRRTLQKNAANTPSPPL